MRAGELREQVQVIGPPAVVTTATGGTRAIGPGTAVTAWGRVLWNKGTERLRLAGVTAQQACEVLLRTPVTVTPAHHLVTQGRTVNVFSVTPDPKGAYVTVLGYDTGAVPAPPA